MSSPASSERSPDLYDQLNSALDRMPTTSAHYWLFVLVAAGTLFNAIEQYNVGYAGPVLTEQWSLSQTAVGALSTATFGAMAVGSLIAGFCGDRFGRKNTFMANILLFTVGSLLAALAPNYVVLLLARILIGIGLGGEISLGFTVVSELMPTRRRGAMTSGLSFVAGGIGIFAASGLAALVLGPLADSLGGEETAWRWLFGVMFLPAVLLVWYRRYIPETPRHLLRHGHVNETNRILSLLADGRLRSRPGDRVVRWIDGPEGVPARSGEEQTRVSDLFARGVRSRTLISWILTLCFFGGVVTFTIFIPTLLTSRGLSVGMSLAFATIANFAGLAGGIVGIFAAQLLRRRTVYVSGAIVLLLLALGLAVFTGPVATLVLAAGIQLVAQIVAGTHWAYLPELFPTRVRATGAGSAATVGLAASALVDAYGAVAVFITLAVLYTVIAITAYRGPETAGVGLIETVEQPAAPVRV